MITEKVRRCQLYFGVWGLCIKYHLPDAFALRSLNHKHIAQLITSRRIWAQRVNHGGSWRHPNMQPDATVVQDLHTWCDFLTINSIAKKITFFGDFMYLYCNDQELISQLQTLPGSISKITEVSVQGDPRKIYLKTPQHRYRSFFRYRKISLIQKQNLAQCLQAQQQDLKLSRSLHQWLDHDRVLLPIQEYFFLDHDSPTLVTLLSLIDPGLIRKTMPIEADK